MNCDEIRELLPRWADRDEGGLSDEERRLVASHLETCPDCRQALKELEEVTSMVRALPPIGAPWSVEHRARELGHFHARRITTEPPLELTAALRATPPVPVLAARARRDEVMESAVGAAGDEAAPAPMAQMAAPHANRVWVVVAVVVAIVAALAYWLLR
jgi:hypothetical protein